MYMGMTMLYMKVVMSVDLPTPVGPRTRIRA